VLLVAPTGEHLKYVVQMHFPQEKVTNNTTEYEGLLVGLRIATELEIKKLIICRDSQLVVRQVNKDYQSPLMDAFQLLTHWSTTVWIAAVSAAVVSGTSTGFCAQAARMRAEPRPSSSE
jgi:ribonuclease HI